MTADPLSPTERARANERMRRKYAKEAPTYDKGMDFWERWLFGSENRGWACSQAIGDTLEVAIGTGLNLPHYPLDVRLTGVDFSPEMLALAKTSATKIGRTIELKEGDAQNLPFADGSFDTVVCTYALCSVPDEVRAIAEMKRVLKPGGRLILVDHVRSTVTPLFWLQWAYEFIPSRTKGEYMNPPTGTPRDEGRFRYQGARSAASGNHRTSTRTEARPAVALGIEPRPTDQFRVSVLNQAVG